MFNLDKIDIKDESAKEQEKERLLELLKNEGKSGWFEQAKKMVFLILLLIIFISSQACCEHFNVFSFVKKGKKGRGRKEKGCIKLQICF